MSKSERKLVAVVGPTGSGKTTVAVALAKEYNGIIISADSRQVYEGLDTGTNKEGDIGVWQDETTRIIDGIPQLLIDTVKPGDESTLYTWLTESRRLLGKIWAEGKLPIVVGGTGLYISALLDGYDLGSGRNARKRSPVNFESLILEMNIDREQLRYRSDQRFELIFDQLIVETQKLIDGGVSAKWLKRIGLDYRYAAKFIGGELGKQRAVEEYKTASRKYIRRQLTWWRHHGEPIKVKTENEAIKTVREFL